MCTGILADESRSSDLRQPLEPAIAPVGAVVQKSGRILLVNAADGLNVGICGLVGVAVFSRGLRLPTLLFPQTQLQEKGERVKGKEKEKRVSGTNFCLGLVK